MPQEEDLEEVFDLRRDSSTDARRRNVSNDRTDSEGDAEDSRNNGALTRKNSWKIGSNVTQNTDGTRNSTTRKNGNVNHNDAKNARTEHGKTNEKKVSRDYSAFERSKKSRGILSWLGSAKVSDKNLAFPNKKKSHASPPSAAPSIYQQLVALLGQNSKGDGR